MLLRQTDAWARFLAAERVGINIPTNIAIIPDTTRSSINVKARFFMMRPIPVGAKATRTNDCADLCAAIHVARVCAGNCGVHAR